MPVNKHLSEKSVDNDPFLQFEKWFSVRLDTRIKNPNAFSLATSSLDGSVTVRTVLLKEYDNRGFVFFTNYLSKKGKQLSENPRAAMLFYWPEKGRQIRIEGKAKKIPPQQSSMYFSSRPRESRIGAWVSEQSAPIPGKEYLVAKFEDLRDKYKGKNIPLPPFWGGYRIVPYLFEFWQEGKNRLHDRIIYIRSESGWTIKRLAP